MTLLEAIETLRTLRDALEPGRRGNPWTRLIKRAETPRVAVDRQLEAAGHIQTVLLEEGLDDPDAIDTVLTELTGTQADTLVQVESHARRLVRHIYRRKLFRMFQRSTLYDDERGLGDGPDADGSDLGDGPTESESHPADHQPGADGAVLPVRPNLAFATQLLRRACAESIADLDIRGQGQRRADLEELAQRIDAFDSGEFAAGHGEDLQGGRGRQVSRNTARARARADVLTVVRRWIRQSRRWDEIQAQTSAKLPCVEPYVPTDLLSTLAPLAVWILWDKPSVLAVENARKFLEL